MIDDQPPQVHGKALAIRLAIAFHSNGATRALPSCSTERIWWHFAVSDVDHFIEGYVAGSVWYVLSLRTAASVPRRPDIHAVDQGLSLLLCEFIRAPTLRILRGSAHCLSMVWTKKSSLHHVTRATAVAILGGGWGGNWSLRCRIRSWSSGSGWV